MSNQGNDNQWNQLPPQGRPQGQPPQQPRYGNPSAPPNPGLTPAEPRKTRRKTGVIIVSIIAILALIAGAAFWFLRDPDRSADAAGSLSENPVTKSLAEMAYLRANDPGPEAFFESIVKEEWRDEADQAEYPEPTLTGGQASNGNGLFGGESEWSPCDGTTRLANALRDDESLAQAFAKGVGLEPESLYSYVDALTPLVLLQDTWVTNHRYVNGQAVPHQAILQRGTAVLVDVMGVPRVRCASGAPLTEAWTGYTAPGPTATPWDGYVAKNVIAIYEKDGEDAGQFLAYDFRARKVKVIGVYLYDRERQSEARFAVTNETQMTVPNDMHAEPDTSLLDSLGMDAATEEDGAKRPRGGGRFITSTGSFGPEENEKAADERDLPGEVNPEGFMDELHYTSFTVGSNGEHGACVYKNARFYCSSPEIPEDLKVHMGLGDLQSESGYAEQVRVIGLGNDTDVFYLLGSTSLREIEPYFTASVSRELRPGQSIRMGDSTCEVTETEFRCENDQSSFRSVYDDGLYFFDSTTKVGEKCADGIQTVSGGVDCSEAERVTAALRAANTPEHNSSSPFYLDDYICRRMHGRMDQYLGFQATCVQQEFPFNKFNVAELPRP